MNRYLTMKHSLLIVASASLFAASQWASAQAFNGAGGAAGDWEFRIGPVFQESKKVNFNGGSYADIDSSTGFKIGSGYHLTDQVIIGGNFGHGQSNFNGVVQSGTPGINAAVENGHVDFNTLMFDATYLLLPGAFKPYGKVGLGWNWLDTNIASGPPQGGCWWDPWFGYICSAYQPTHGSSSFAYQVAGGLQVNLNRSFAIDVDYQYTWIDVQHASGTPGFGAVELLFVWRFPGHY
jgi:opacity protein-like surface antigen